MQEIEFSYIWDMYRSSAFAQGYRWSWYGKCRLEKSLHIWK